MSAKPQNVAELLEAVEIIRVGICVYRGLPRCDCKFGVRKVGMQCSEHGSGCPELYEVLTYLRALTPFERDRLERRVAKGPR